MNSYHLSINVTADPDVNVILNKKTNVWNAKVAGFYMALSVKRNVLQELSELRRMNVPSVLLDVKDVLVPTLVKNVPINTSKKLSLDLEVVLKSADPDSSMTRRPKNVLNALKTVISVLIPPNAILAYLTSSEALMELVLNPALTELTRTSPPKELVNLVKKAAKRVTATAYVLLAKPISS
jgi:hypothetical protein